MKKTIFKRFHQGRLFRFLYHIIQRESYPPEFDCSLGFISLIIRVASNGKCFFINLPINGNLLHLFDGFTHLLKYEFQFYNRTQVLKSFCVFFFLLNTQVQSFRSGLSSNDIFSRFDNALTIKKTLAQIVRAFFCILMMSSIFFTFSKWCCLWYKVFFIAWF